MVRYLDKQVIKTSEGCPYSCAFCFNGKNKFKELLRIEQVIAEINCNYVIFHDDAFLSRKDILDDINKLGNLRANGRVVHYEILQGINKKDLTQKIANALYKNRFKKIRFAWDGSYSKKNMYKVIDCIKYLTKAGYNKKNLICYILSNYYVSLPENIFKLDLLKVKNISVCNCRYKKNYLDPKVYPEHWTSQEIDYFKERCRWHNQLIKFDGFDPEIAKRLSHLRNTTKIFHTKPYEVSGNSSHN